MQSKHFLKSAVIFLIFVALLYGCRRNREPEVTISADSVALEMREEKSLPNSVEKKSNIRRIDIGPSKRLDSETVEPKDEMEEPVRKIRDVVLPPDTYEETDLTNRLREKMMDAYAGKEDSIPNVKIYLSDMRYDEFIKYYKKLGYKVHTVAVPAMEVIGPVLEQRPEMAGKIKVADYQSVVIHQVMIEEAGISAADKYIDPDTFEVIDRTFVTKMTK